MHVECAEGIFSPIKFVLISVVNYNLAIWSELMDLVIVRSSSTERWRSHEDLIIVNLVRDKRGWVQTMNII